MNLASVSALRSHRAWPPAQPRRVPILVRASPRPFFDMGGGYRRGAEFFVGAAAALCRRFRALVQIRHLADLGRAEDHQQRPFLRPDILEALHHAGWERDSIPRTKLGLARALLAPEELPFAVHWDEHLDHFVAMQRRACSRLHRIE